MRYNSRQRLHRGHQRGECRQNDRAKGSDWLLGSVSVASHVSEKRLRIFFVTSGGTTSRGGMGRMALYLTREFQRDHPLLDVRVFDSYGPGRPTLMPFYFLRCLITIGILCLVRPPDAVHLNLAAHGSTVRKLLLMWLVRAFRIPTLLHIHASKFIPFCESLGARSRKMLVASLARASCIVVIGDYWRRYIVESLGVPADIVTVIHNAVPLPERPAPRAGGTRCRIVALGLLGPRKGTPELLNALATPAMRELSWDAVIAGNGEVEISRRRTATLGLMDRVHIPGWVDAATVAELLSTADIFVLPSHNEGLPVSILEAMGAGLPVVTTPVGAIPELVVAETGILVLPGSAPSLAAALAELVKDPELRRRLGSSARARVEQHFRIEDIAGRFASIYRALALESKSNRCGGW
jgi:glycosyltransferase involved in cell wall biosynthesis